ncbi:MAG: hypothetical protein LBU17_10180 [Treponema sp.]|nr:hypothetical protein [Treponema sp.]
MATQHNQSTGAEDDFDVIEGITTVLDTLAVGLDNLAEAATAPAVEEVPEM